MNELISSSNNNLIPLNESIMKIIPRLDSKTVLSLGGMACLTTVICIGIVSFSGSEMTLSKDGLSISQPITAYT